MITFLYGELRLKSEFVWIGRKTIRKILFNKYEYFVCTPYLKASKLNLEQAEQLKFRLVKVYSNDIQNSKAYNERS